MKIKSGEVALIESSHLVMGEDVAVLIVEKQQQQRRRSSKCMKKSKLNFINNSFVRKDRR